MLSGDIYELIAKAKIPPAEDPITLLMGTFGCNYFKAL
jgi:hypothetical protein